MSLPLNTNVTVIAGCTDVVIDGVIAKLRAQVRPVVVVSEPQQLEARTEANWVVYHYLEDTTQLMAQADTGGAVPGMARLRCDKR